MSLRPWPTGHPWGEAKAVSTCVFLTASLKRQCVAMTPGHVVFWVYLSAFGFMAGIPALVFGLIARLFARPFDTPHRVRVFQALLVPTLLLGLIASSLSYNLVSNGGAVPWLRANSLIGPFGSGLVIYLWASGFPLGRILFRRP
jgi:hypothetical protein